MSIPGAEHPHDGQQPQALDVAGMNSKNTRALMSDTQEQDAPERTGTLADLAALSCHQSRRTGVHAPTIPGVKVEPKRDALGPVLRHRAPQERDCSGCGSSRARARSRVNGKSCDGVFRPSGVAHVDRAALPGVRPL